jgi:hypothetical protein
MILFLDFDGVLHPANNPVGDETDFCRLPLLEEWLRARPNVNIVISSSWRELMKLDKLQQLFNTDLRHRIIDTCPILTRDQEYEYYRYAEILAWIRQTKYTGKWIALDDVAKNFPPDFAQLVLCQKEVGIDAHAIQALNDLYEQLNH